MRRIAVVILNYNGKKLLEQFLPSVTKYTSSLLADIIVADNASLDDSLTFLKENYPSIGIISLNKNYGFSAGYNLALEHLDHEYAVLLNSDVEVTENWLEPLVSYLDFHKDVVAAQPKILSYRSKDSFEYAGAAGGYIDKNAYPFCRGRIFQTVEKDAGQYDEVKQIFWASGACLFIRLQGYHDAGGLDPSFFAHQEEIDLCWRLALQGKKIVCIPYSVIYHLGGATLNAENPKKTYLNFRNNLLLIYKNVPEKRLKKILFVRFFMDALAAFSFLLKGDFSNAGAVVRAHKNFYKLKPQYKSVRENIQPLNRLVEESALIYPRNIVMDYYFHGIKYFSLLKWKNQIREK